MMHRVADAVANWLVKKNAISTEDSALYSYAMFCVIITLIPIVLSIIVGIITNMLIESLLFITPFVLIRKYSGGFHLKSPNVCLFVSIGIIAVFILCIKLVLQYELYSVPLICMLPFGVLLFIKSPIDTEERKLSERETVVFGRIARVMVIIFLIIVLILAYYHIFRIAIPISFGIILSGALQVPCCFIEKKQ